MVLPGQSPGRPPRAGPGPAQAPALCNGDESKMNSVKGRPSGAVTALILLLISISGHAESEFFEVSIVPMFSSDSSSVQKVSDLPATTKANVTHSTSGKQERASEQEHVSIAQNLIASRPNMDVEEKNA